MKVVNNMKLLGGSSETKKTSGGFSLKFDNQKVHKCMQLRCLLKLSGRLPI